MDNTGQSGIIAYAISMMLKYPIVQNIKLLVQMDLSMKQGTTNQNNHITPKWYIMNQNEAKQTAL